MTPMFSALEPDMHLFGTFEEELGGDAVPTGRTKR